MATTDKYDRQVRLWGPRGQSQLGRAKICVLGAGPTATETLKNLVLPGCEEFVIIDNAVAEEGDVGNNFFVEPDDVGKPLAEVVCKRVLELNPEVQGKGIQAPPSEFVPEYSDYLCTFSLVIVTQFPQHEVTKIETILRPRNIPLLHVRSYGLLGYVRVAMREHTIVDASPEFPVNGLRLFQPFPALQEYADSLDLKTLPDDVRSHVPFVVLLLQHIQRWMDTHDGRRPRTFEEQKAFRQQIKNDSKAFDKDENFQEAVQKAYLVYSKPSMPQELYDALNAPQTKNLTSGSADFWFMMAALKDFMANEGGGTVPVVAELEDMTSTTAYFLDLQKLYGDKAQQDAEAFRRHLAHHLRSAGLEGSRIPAADTAFFLKHAAYARFIPYRSIEAEAKEPSTETMASVLETAPFLIGDEEKDLEQLPIRWYFMLRLADSFYAQNKRFPGSSDAYTTVDVTAMSKMVRDQLEMLKLPDSFVSSKHIEEIVRFGGAEIHALAAFIGGVAAQEAVKIIAGKFVPINNTYIYNGINGFAAVYQLQLS